MSFIADVIYGLKIDYGTPGTIKRDVYTIDLSQGTKTAENVWTQYINNLIWLPLRMRQAFYKAINLQTEMYLQSGEEQLLIDARDVSSIPQLNDYILDPNNNRYDVTKVENIHQEAFMVTVRQLI